MNFTIPSKVWAAEVELVAQLIANDLAWVSMETCECQVTVFCNHEWRYILHATTIHAEETTIDFIDSETIREADRRASAFRGASTHRNNLEPAQHSATAQSNHSDNGGF